MFRQLYVVACADIKKSEEYTLFISIILQLTRKAKTVKIEATQDDLAAKHISKKETPGNSELSSLYLNYSLIARCYTLLLK